MNKITLILQNQLMENLSQSPHRTLVIHLYNLYNVIQQEMGLNSLTFLGHFVLGIKVITVIELLQQFSMLQDI